MANRIMLFIVFSSLTGMAFFRSIMPCLILVISWDCWFRSDCKLETSVFNCPAWNSLIVLVFISGNSALDNLMCIFYPVRWGRRGSCGGGVTHSLLPGVLTGVHVSQKKRSMLFIPEVFRRHDASKHNTRLALRGTVLLPLN